MNGYSRMTIAAAHKLLRQRQITAVELAEQYLAAIARENPALNAYVLATEELALTQAKAADAALSRGEEVSPLCGIPFVLKDNICTRGIATTCCSRMLEDFIPPYDATLWHRLQGQGAVLLGKGNMDEFAVGSSGESSLFGAAKNPHNHACVAGGSSGGVAAAVAGGLAVWGLGSDTGGSVRQPASFCGVYGLKPTYGALSRYGLIAYASSLDTLGPITHTAEDAALVLDALCAPDVRDATCTGGGQAVWPTLGQPVRGLRIGVVDELFCDLQPAVATAMQTAMDNFTRLGVQLVPLSLPVVSSALSAYYITSSAELASNLGRYDGVRYGLHSPATGDMGSWMTKNRSAGFGRELKRRILLGNYLLSSDGGGSYQRAWQLRHRLKAALDELFGRCDLLFSPTVPTTAFPFGFAVKRPVEAYHTDRCTVLASLAGLPALSVPCGVDEQGLPIGMQLMGGRLAEGTILRLAHRYEQAYGLREGGGIHA